MKYLFLVVSIAMFISHVSTQRSYTLENGETLILDDNCTVKNDPDRQARNTIPG